MKNKILVITPYYKGEKTIMKTIDSVFQSFKKVENEIELHYMVVIDSMEDKEMIYEILIKKYHDKVEIIKNEKNIGVADSRNNALRAANSNFDYVVFLDQDDLIDEKYFEAMLKEIKKNADLIIANAYVVNIKTQKKVKMYYKKPDLSFEAFLKGNKILTPGQVMFSKNICKIKDLFRGCSKEFKGADDWASYLNIFIKFPNINIKYIKEAIFYYNQHENNYSNNWIEMNMSTIKTAEYFKGSVGEQENKLLNKHIKFLEFEILYKSKKQNINVIKIINYYSYKLRDMDKLLHFISKKIYRYNKA